MNRAFKIYGWACLGAIGAFILSIVIVLIINSCNRFPIYDLERSPENLEKIVDVDLPSISDVETERSHGSEWSNITYRLRFSEPVFAESIAMMEYQCNTDPQHWWSGAELYGYCLTLSECQMECLIYKDYAEVTYSTLDITDEEFTVAAFFYILVYLPLKIWGIILVCIAICRSFRKKEGV